MREDGMGGLQNMVEVKLIRCMDSCVTNSLFDTVLYGKRRFSIGQE